MISISLMRDLADGKGFGGCWSTEWKVETHHLLHDVMHFMRYWWYDGDDDDDDDNEVVVKKKSKLLQQSEFRVRSILGN